MAGLQSTFWGAVELGSESWLCHWTSVRILAIDVIALNLGFPTCKVESTFSISEFCEEVRSSFSRCQYCHFPWLKMMIIYISVNWYIFLFCFLILSSCPLTSLYICRHVFRDRTWYIKAVLHRQIDYRKSATLLHVVSRKVAFIYGVVVV